MTKSDEKIDLSDWKEFYLCKSFELNCKVCLGEGGQSFTWESLDFCTWFNVIDGYCVIIRDHSESSIINLYVPSDLDSKTQEDALESVRNYLRLNENLEELCLEWSRADPKFPKNFPGIRLLRQDPLETLFAFICSQNNLISRIKHLVKTLKKEFGTIKGIFTFPSVGSVEFYSFPSDVKVFLDSEQQLREWKFGYRAKYISGAAAYLTENNFINSNDLCKLRSCSYDISVKFLRAVPGIGPKVADCIALMSLDQMSSVPIDTHIWRIARERYKFTPSSSSKTKVIANLNDKLYREIGDKFRELFGERAGWAHSVLFTAELKTFKNSNQKKK